MMPTTSNDRVNPPWACWEVPHDDLAATYGIPYLTGDYCHMWLWEYQSIHDLIVAGDLAGALSLLEQFDSEAKYSHYLAVGGVCKFLLSQMIRQRLGGPGAVDGGRHDDDVAASAIEDAVIKIGQFNTRRVEEWDPVAGRDQWQRDGWHFTREEIAELLAEEWESAKIWASLSVLDSKRDHREIDQLVDREAVLAEALRLIEAEMEG